MFDSPPAAQWQVCHLTDLAWDVARAAETIVTSGECVGDEHLVTFWQATRGLANQWLRELSAWTSCERTAADAAQFQALTVEMLAGDLLLRLWGTVLSVQDRQAPSSTARPVLDLSIFNLQHVRHRLLSALLVEAADFTELDRFRRRCERWTDVLLGPLVVRYGHAQYAHDPRRAWDFGEDAATDDISEISERMLRSSYRTAFADDLAGTPLRGTAWDTVFCSIDQQASQALGLDWPTSWRDLAMTHSATTLRIAEAPLDSDAGHDLETESALVRGLRQMEARRQGS